MTYRIYKFYRLEKVSDPTDHIDYKPRTCTKYRIQDLQTTQFIESTNYRLHNLQDRSTDCKLKSTESTDYRSDAEATKSIESTDQRNLEYKLNHRL